MPHPPPTLSSARSEAVRSNPNLLTWLRVDTQAPRRTKSTYTARDPFERSDPHLLGLTPLSLYETIMPQVYLWETAQERRDGKVRAERRKYVLKRLRTGVHEEQPNQITIRTDLISTRPGFLPSADNFQNLKMSAYLVRQAGPATYVHIVADVQVEQDSTGQWHGRATVAIPQGWESDRRIIAKVVDAI